MPLLNGLQAAGYTLPKTWMIVIEMTDYQPIDIVPWLRKHASRLQSPFEQLFVRNVLAHVPGIDLDSVDTQYCFTDTEGGTRFCDFVIQEGETLRIAIEIDGYDKAGRGAGMSHAEFVDWQRRHASLVAQGWDVFHVPPNERASGVLTHHRGTFRVNSVITHHISNHIYTGRRKFVGTVLQRSVELVSCCAPGRSC
ncbi:hypothetical protein [Pseudomonas fluorescens]|uniref:hypothetical protein n=1 Tax=Pseudomonas fluorescens TaxID=294 RepID=UPI00123FA511|nr:hypothetical protein [Pseudomonas fluorescens]